MMLHPDLLHRLNDAHQRDLLRQARHERLVAGTAADRDDIAEHALHWLGGGLAFVARRLETYHRPRPLCADCG